MLMRQMADSEKMPVLPDKWPILYSLFGWYSLRARVASQLLLLPITRITFLLASHIFTCSPIFVSSNFSPCWGSSPQTPAKGTKSLWNPYVHGGATANFTLLPRETAIFYNCIMFYILLARGAVY